MRTKLSALWNSDQTAQAKIIMVFDAFSKFFQRELPSVVIGHRWDNGVLSACDTTLIGWDRDFPDRKIEVKFTEKVPGWGHPVDPNTKAEVAGPGVIPANEWTLKVFLAEEDSEFVRKTLELLVEAGCPSVKIIGLLGVSLCMHKDKGITPQEALELLPQPAAAA